MGHDPRKAAPAPGSVPAGSMRMPPTAAQLRTDATVDERLAWLEQQVRSLAAKAYGPPAPPADAHSCTTVAANMATLAEAWEQRLGLLASQRSDTLLSVPRARLHGRGDELERCRQDLLTVLGWEAPASPSTPVRSAVDERLAGLIGQWEANAQASENHAAMWPDTDRATEDRAEAAVYRACVRDLRGGV
jgi:hypothetical protein